MTATSTMPIFIHGDPTIRGLAGLPTMMTVSDVQQGAGSDTNVAMSLSSTQAAFDAFTNGPTAPITTPSVGGVDVGAVVNSLTGSGASGSTTNSGNDTDCTNVSVFAHPIDALNCMLNRFLFGIVAIVLLGGGLYIFAQKD